MSWTDPDVTPVGPTRQASPVPERGDASPDGDPFGRRRRSPQPVRGALLLVLGLALVIGGMVATGVGIARAVEAGAGIGDEAVARGTVRLGGGGPVRFTAAAPDYSVYLDFDGVTSNTERQERAVGAASCEVTTAAGRTTIRGSRQGTSVTLGDYVTLGTFSAADGPASIECAYTRRRYAVLGRPSRVPFLVTPGRPSDTIGGILLIAGGVTAALAGGWAALAGRRRRR